MSDLGKLKEQVLALDPTERDDLLRLIEFDQSRALVQPSREDMVVWEALRVQSPTSPFRSLPEFLRDKRHGVARLIYADAVATLYRFADEAQPVRHKAQDNQALVEIALRCLADDLKLRHVEVTPKTLIEQLPRLRTAVNRAFPGYVESKMMHVLIRAVAAE